MANERILFMKFSRINGLKGQIQVPGDKSISHRSVMFGSIAQGTTEIHGYLQGAELFIHHFLFPENGRFY